MVISLGLLLDWAALCTLQPALLYQSFAVHHVLGRAARRENAVAAARAARRRVRRAKARARLVRQHHPRWPHKVAGASFSGEMMYHVAELAGFHTLLSAAAALLLAMGMIQLLFQFRD
jgi:4'-phosphopantetheinyl transferase EntD